MKEKGRSSGQSAPCSPRIGGDARARNADGAEPSASSFEFSTDPVADAERFEFFNELIAARYLGFDAARSLDPRFMGRMRARLIGEALVTQNFSSAAEWRRERKSLLEDDEFVMIALMQAGSACVQQAGEMMHLTPGSLVVFSSAWPSIVEIAETSKTLTLRLPRHLFETTLKPGQGFRPALMSLEEPAVRLAVHYIATMAESVRALDAPTAALASRHVSELIATALHAHSGARIPDSPGVRAARAEAILQQIAEQHATPGFSARVAASAIGVSERHLHRLLEGTNRTFAEHLLEARLGAAFKMLSDPHFDALRIGAIAERAGFADVTHFNRAFKARFGATPGDIRNRR